MTENSSLTNLNSTETCDEIYDEVTFESKPLFFICLVGIVLNVICLNTLLKPKLNGIFYKLLSFLAVSDLMFLVGMFVKGILVLKVNEDWKDSVLFYLSGMIRFSGALSGSITLAISIDRFMASHFPHTRTGWKMETHKRAFVGYAIYAICNTAISSAHKFVEENNDLKIDLQKVDMCLFVFNVLLLVLLNILIYRKMKKLDNSESVFVKQEKSTYLIVIYIAASTMILYSSLTVYNVFKLLCLSENLQFSAFSVVVYLFILNSTCNLVIYSWTGKDIRTVLLETWKIKKFNGSLETGSSSVASKSSKSFKNSIQVEMISFNKASPHSQSDGDL